MNFNKKHLVTIQKMLENQGVINNVGVELDRQGCVTEVFQAEADDDLAHAWAGLFVPGLVNAHSHVFQYAMRGFAEYLSSQQTHDDFWSWRQRMYEVALKIEPEELAVIAEFAYREMLLRGFSHVVEFHYLHHDPDGHPYPDMTRMSDIIIAAARKVGIGITLVPVYYSRCDFDKAAIAEQRRFLFSSLSEYTHFIDELEQKYATTPRVNIGAGVHSLRAATSQDVQGILSHFHHKPLHIHIAEQVKEVESCVAAWGCRPVEWLARHCSLNSNFNLVHATHVSKPELEKMIEANVCVILCPTTEGNLGDGIFPLTEYSGQWAIGTDSHIRVDPFEELRFLDFMQRAARMRRNIFAKNAGEHSALQAYKMAYLAGWKAAGFAQKSCQFVNVGDCLNGIILDLKAPALLGRPDGFLWDSALYAGDVNMIQEVIVAGKPCLDQLKKDQDGLKSSMASILKRLISY